MKLFKRNEIYYVRLSKDKRISLKTKNKKEAEKLFKEIKLKYLRGEFNLENKNIRRNLADVINEYIDYIDKVREKSTKERYLYSLTRFLEIVGDKKLYEVSVKDIELFVVERQERVKPVTINMDLRHLKAFFNKLVEWKYINESPVKVKPLKVDKNFVRFLTKEEIENLFEVIKSEKFRVLFALYIYTGRRRNEILELKLEDIDMKNNLLKYYNKKKKLYNYIPIVKPLQRILYDYIKDNYLKIVDKQGGYLFRLDSNYVTRKFKEYFKAINKEDFRLHDLRHSFASYLVSKNISLRIIQKLLDHSEISTTEIYSHVNKELEKRVLDEAFNDLDLNMLSSKKRPKDDQICFTGIIPECSNKNKRLKLKEFSIKAPIAQEDRALDS